MANPIFNSRKIINKDTRPPSQNQIIPPRQQSPIGSSSVPPKITLHHPPSSTPSIPSIPSASPGPSHSRLVPQSAAIQPIFKRTLPIPTKPLEKHLLLGARRWLVTFALINFDLDEGPDFDNCYPPAHFSSAQLSNIAFSSFPDSAQTGSLLFNWRIPARDAPSPSTPSSSGPPQPETSDLCGYVYFIQQRDPAVHRGYNQRSLVLITHMPDYSGLFATLIARLGPLHATRGPSALEAALADMAAWPDPAPGTSLTLGFLGHTLHVSVPLANQAQLVEPRPQMLMQPSSSNSDGQILASTPPTYLSYLLFGRPPPSPPPNPTTMSATNPSAISSAGLGLLQSTPAIPISTLWTLWEIVVLAEPLVVFGNNPEVVSAAVLHLKNLIRPIPFQGDWRPYITIHDPDFPSLFNKTKARTATLIGATNPIIFSNTHTWPHVLNLSTSSFSSIGNSSGGSGSGGIGGGGGVGGQIMIGLSTERKRQIQKDKNVVKCLENCIARRDYHQADVIISRHFSVLTEQFLQPLQRYFTTLLPVEQPQGVVGVEGRGGGTISEMQEPERARTFNSTEFLKSLKSSSHSTLVDFRSRFGTTSLLLIGVGGGGSGSGGQGSVVVGFYTRFLRSSNFSGWLHVQVEAATKVVRDRFVNKWLDKNNGQFENWVKGKSEEQVEALVARIEKELAAGQSSEAKPWTANPATTPDQRWSFDAFRSGSRVTPDSHIKRGARRPSVPVLTGSGGQGSGGVAGGGSGNGGGGSGGGGGRTERLRAQAERLRMMSFGPTSHHQSSLSSS